LLTQYLVYPAEACRANQSGTMTVDISISANGEIGQAVLVDKSGYPSLDAEAVNVWQRMKDNSVRLDIPSDFSSRGRPFGIRLPIKFSLR
jgi:TonB family protein